MNDNDVIMTKLIFFQVFGYLFDEPRVLRCFIFKVKKAHEIIRFRSVAQGRQGTGVVRAFENHAITFR